MSKPESIKEEIGWLKAFCGFLLAGEASLFTWIVQSYASATRVLLIPAFVVALLLLAAIVVVIHRMYRCIRVLEAL